MIAIGADHGGHSLKEALKKHFDQNNIHYKDFGAYTSDSVDYPDYALAVGKSILSGECTEGILCCGTGVGIAIAANKIPGIRAAVAGDCFTAQATKEHNHSNILCLGGRVLGDGLAIRIVDTWMKASFSGGRHQKRIDRIREIEEMKW